jgi:hypothetical protein
MLMIWIWMEQGVQRGLVERMEGLVGEGRAKEEEAKRRHLALQHQMFLQVEQADSDARQHIDKVRGGGGLSREMGVFCLCKLNQIKQHKRNGTQRNATERNGKHNATENKRRL